MFGISARDLGGALCFGRANLAGGLTNGVKAKGGGGVTGCEVWGQPLLTHTRGPWFQS